MVKRLLVVLTLALLTTSGYAKKSKVARVIEPCDEVAMNETTHLRAVGTARSSLEKVARSEALRDARTQLAQRIHLAVEAVATDLAKSSDISSEGLTKRLSESVATQYVTQYVDSSKPIKWSIYDLSDGRVEIFVCVEMLQNEDASIQNLLNCLNQDDLINSKPERDRAIGEIKKSLSSYREQLLNR